MTYIINDETDTPLCVLYAMDAEIIRISPRVIARVAVAYKMEMEED